VLIAGKSIIKKAALTIFCLSVPVFAAHAETLQGGVAHSEYLPAMPQQSQPGSTFQGAQEQASTVIWYQIPTWLAGTWQSDFITNTVTQVYSTAAPKHRASGPMKHVSTFGTLPDARGQIWHADLLPHVGYWEGAQAEVQTTVEKQCVHTGDDKVVLHIHNQSVYLDPSRQRVVYSEQVDGFKSLMPIFQTGEVGNYDDIQEYDSQGSPLDRYIATTKMRKIQNFQPKDSENGVDLRASLAQYLSSLGRTDLIPGASPPTQ
jgi:hypothetical protein